MKYGLLSKVKDLGDIEWQLCATLYASFDLFEFSHDWFNLFLQTLVGQANTIRIA